VVLQEPAIEPQADVKDPVELWSGIGARTGFAEYFDKTNDEWCEIRLQTEYPLLASVEPKVTLERLKKEKAIRFNAPADMYYDGWVVDQGQWATETGRLEFYAERLKDLGLAITHPRPTMRVGQSEEYPFQFFSGRQRFFMQSSFTDDPINIALSGGSPATRLNPIDARALGFEDGDMIEVYNEMGHVVTRLEISESVPAGTVHTWFGWRARQFEEGTYSECVTTYASAVTNQAIEEKWAEDWVAAGYSFNMFTDPISAEIASSDCYWDSWCNIRKYEAGKEA
jgi:anaerobic selenocysteine-containing dehydrogenase